MKKPIVSIQGIEGSFHAQAAQKFFGDNHQVMACPSFKSTCDAVYKGRSDYAVMAIENSIAGSLLPNYGLMQGLNLSIVGEVFLPIKLYLMGLPGVKFEDVKYVHSHPIAIRQCIEFFEEFPDKEILEKNDTAACAKAVKDNNLKDTFAIAGEMSADIYGLEIKERRIEKTSKNFTRFLILQKHTPTSLIKEANKATICFHVGSGVGSLAKVLNTLAEHKINLTKIQSTPVLGFPEKDNFFIDLTWDSYQEYELALSKIMRLISNFTVLGEYKQHQVFL